MEIVISSRRIEKLCNSSEEMRAKLGDRNAKLLQQRLSEVKDECAIPTRTRELGVS